MDPNISPYPFVPIDNPNLSYPCPMPKDPYPLKSFADPLLHNTCAKQGIIDPFSPPRAITTWSVRYLVSANDDYASHINTKLIDPRGLIVYNNQVVVVTGTTDLIMYYDIYGNQATDSITIREAVHNSSHPTSIAINCGGQGTFLVSQENLQGHAELIVATEHGTVHGYNPNVNAGRSFVIINEQSTGIINVYKGLAVVGETMYLANFFDRSIDVFFSDYTKPLGYDFVDSDMDPRIPENYAPFNVVHIGCYLYVVWARFNESNRLHEKPGMGTGFVSIFNTDGSFVRRFTSGGVLNAPWAMIPAPQECGIPYGSFLIGNTGDGCVNVFANDGRYVGPFLNSSGVPVTIEGLWGLAPRYSETNQIYFSASENQDVDGHLGVLVKDQIINF